MPKSKKKILIVEDERLMAEMYRDTFEERGFDVVLACTSEEALKKAEAEKPDLIILDILLPTESGVVFLEKLRKRFKDINFLVVALSNYDEMGTRERVMDLGVKAYLLKTDFTPQALTKKIAKYLK